MFVGKRTLTLLQQVRNRVIATFFFIRHHNLPQIVHFFFFFITPTATLMRKAMETIANLGGSEYYNIEKYTQKA